LRAGVSANPSAINVVSGNLAMPPQMTPPVGNSVAINGIGDGNGSSERLALGQLVNSGTVYYSFALRADALTGSNNTTGGFFIAFNNTGNSSQTTNPGVAPARIQGRIDPVDGTKYDIGIFNGAASAGASSWLPAMNVGDTHFVVVGYTFNSGSSTDDVASIWLDPDPSTFTTLTPPVPSATATGTEVASPGIQSLILRQSPAPWLTLDELRIGTDWATVTAPEPASVGLSFIACAALAMLRRRPAV
jgi:hypothetical protein